jgi:hypothetical protein
MPFAKRWLVALHKSALGLRQSGKISVPVYSRAIAAACCFTAAYRLQAVCDSRLLLGWRHLDRGVSRRPQKKPRFLLLRGFFISSAEVRAVTTPT